MIKTLLSIKLLLVILLSDAKAVHEYMICPAAKVQEAIHHNKEAYVSSYLVSTAHPDNKPAACKVYPNPAVDQVNISLASGQAGEMRIEVYDIIGTLTKTEVFSLANGDNHILLGLKDLSKGVYILNIIIGQKKQVVKLIVSK